MADRLDSEVIASLIQTRLAFLGVSGQRLSNEELGKRFDVGDASRDGLNYAIDINGEPFLLTVWLADPTSAPKATDGRRDVYAAEYHDWRAEFRFAVSARAVIEERDITAMVVSLLRHAKVPSDAVQTEARTIVSKLVDAEAQSAVLEALGAPAG